MRLDDWLTGVFGVKTFLLALAASALIAALFQTWGNMTGAGVEPLDVTVGHSTAEVHATIAQYRARAAAVYPRFFFLDLLFPVAYALALSLAMAFVFRRAFPAESAARELSLLPFVVALADYCENFTVLALYLKHPDGPDWLARSAALLTMTKMLLLQVSTLLLVGGVLVLLTKRLRPRARAGGGR